MNCTINSLIDIGLAFFCISTTIGDMYHRFTFVLLSCFLSILIGCTQETPIVETIDMIPIVTSVRSENRNMESEESPIPDQITSNNTVASELDVDENVLLTVAIDVPHHQEHYATFDPFGNIVGLDVDLMKAIAIERNLSYELIAMPHAEILTAVQAGTVDIGLSMLPIPAKSQEGILYTRPYLESGEHLLVRANETTVTTMDTLTSNMIVSAQADSNSYQIASTYAASTTTELLSFDTAQEAVQALSNGEVRGTVVDNYQADFYVNRYPQRFKIAHEFINGSTRFGIAVSTENSDLLNTLNNAIGTIEDNANKTIIIDQWLVDNRSINRGDISLVGTPKDRILIGVIGESGNFDPSDNSFNHINWEIKQNTMSGLLRYDQNNKLVPALAAAMPLISDDGLKYTFTLREGLRFPNGSLLNANAVRNSLVRASQNGNGQLNNFLRDSNLDGFADADAIQAVGNNQIVLYLNEAASHFITFLATPPYFIVNPSCAMATLFDPLTNCNGIGPYTITAYEPNVLVRMDANPRWYLNSPIMSSVELRFYDDSATLRNALIAEQVDIIWHGMSMEDSRPLTQNGNIKVWDGSSIFKSYVVFEHSQEPWDDVRVRRAAAYAINRNELVETVFDNDRQPLFGPIPTGTLGSNPSPLNRDLDKAISLLNDAGYSVLNRLEIDLWYLNDGRYTDREGDYATTIKKQLEETGIFQVTLNSEAWPIYSARMSSCEYPAFLLGWPGATAQRYADPMMWLGHFIYNAEIVCSNYESEEMNLLMASVLGETDIDARTEIYEEVQALWSAELPTLDLTQERNQAVSSTDIISLTIDSLGIMQYETLEK